MIIRDSMNVARHSIDLMGMDPEMFTKTKDVASAQFKELCSSIRDGGKRDATLAGLYIKESATSLAAMHKAVSHESKSAEHRTPALAVHGTSKDTVTPEDHFKEF